MPVAAAASLGELRIVRGCAIGARGAVRSVVARRRAPHRRARRARGRSVVPHERRPRAARPPRAQRGREPRLVGTHAPRGHRRRRRERAARSSSAIRRSRSKAASRTRSTSGSAWRELTGLPFVFAAWCGRAGALSADDERLLRAPRSDGPRRAATPSPTRTPRGRAYRRVAPRRTCATPFATTWATKSAAASSGSTTRRRSAGLLPRARRPLLRRRPPQGSSPVESLDTLLARAADGERLSAAEGERLVADASLFDLGLAADAVRRSASTRTTS